MNPRRSFFLTILLSLALPIQAEDSSESHAIDLATALRLADADNTKIAIAREKVNQAQARLAQAKTLLLPDLAAGASYHHHDGQIQETNGNVLDVERSSSFAGLGAGAVGAGDVQTAGVGLSVNLADAIFAPLAARQRADAAKSNSEAVRNQILFEVASAWYELLRARGALQIASEAFENATALADATRNFADTGEGLESDRERAAVEALVRKRDIEIARENLESSSIKLAWLLRVDPTIRMVPVGSAEARTEWVDVSSGVAPLADQALAIRPELAGSDAEIAATLQELNQHKLAPLIPRISVGASNGGFGGNAGSSPGIDGQRTDVSAGIIWQLNGMGLGYRAEVQERESLYQQARISRADVEIAVAAEVAGALSSVRHRDARIAIGRDAVERAARSYELNRSRVFENQGLPIEVLQAIQSLVAARSMYLDAVIDYNLAQFQLYTAVGQPVAEVEAKDEAVEPKAEDANGWVPASNSRPETEDEAAETERPVRGARSLKAGPFRWRR